METPENTQENKRQLTPAMEAAQWRPGQSGNPGGRPKRKSRSRRGQSKESDHDVR
jgi:hypothetical protein